MYIPLNKIITNLYTNGGELALKSNNQEYIGDYWKDYQGKIYVGKNPNSSNSPSLLIPFVPPSNQGSKVPFIQNAALYNEIWEEYDGPHTITPSLQTYNRVKDIDIEPTLKTPYQQSPQPTKDDYKLGVFTRYFTVKHNQSTYSEIDKDTFDSLNSQKTDWNWQPYLPFSIPWTLTGEEKVVDQTNKSIVYLQEKRNKKLGLREFLRFNYLKFYQTNLES